MINNWRMNLARRLSKSYLEKSPKNTLARSIFSHSSRVSINLYRAQSGFVLEYQKVDNMVGEMNDPSLHLITDDQDLGERIAQIITLEMLRS